jgi:hypothetical protein
MAIDSACLGPPARLAGAIHRRPSLVRFIAALYLFDSSPRIIALHDRLD